MYERRARNTITQHTHFPTAHAASRGGTPTTAKCVLACIPPVVCRVHTAPCRHACTVQYSRCEEGCSPSARSCRWTSLPLSLYTSLSSYLCLSLSPFFTAIAALGAHTHYCTHTHTRHGKHTLCSVVALCRTDCSEREMEMERARERERGRERERAREEEQGALERGDGRRAVCARVHMCVRVCMCGVG